MILKTLAFNPENKILINEILDFDSMHNPKRVKNFDEKRWVEIKVNVMEDGRNIAFKIFPNTIFKTKIIKYRRF